MGVTSLTQSNKMHIRKPTYDVDKLQDDMALKGWLPVDLADAAGVADMTVYRFLRRESQTAKTAKKLAEALGYSIRRYLISAKAIVVDHEPDGREAR